MKKNINVREKGLIDRLNKNVEANKNGIGRWDNHGPIQFEGQDTETTKVVVMDTAEGEDKSVLTLFDTKTGKVKEVEDLRKPYVEPKPEWNRDVHGEIVKMDEYAAKQAKEIDEMYKEEPPTEWDEKRANCPCGEVNINFDPLHNIDEDGASRLMIAALTPEQLAYNDSIKDAKESREGVRNTLIGRKTLDDVAEKVAYDRLLKNKPYVNALKKAINNEDTRLRTPYEEVNHPQHYNNYDVEVIDMMERIFGKEETAVFCKLNAFKYRMRAGTKPGQDVEKDLNKEKWYLDKMRELGNKDE